MTQYVIQIQVAENGAGVGWLAKCFEVTEQAPIPSVVPSNRVQVIMTNTASFNSIVAVYDQYTTAAIFSYDEPGAKIDCSGAVIDSWPIN
jgi:hypothetical protein